MDAEALELAMRTLSIAAQIIERIQQSMARRGYPDVRPAHGFAFVRISAGDASTLDVAEHLGVTKQAASQLVEQLVARGYVERTVDPDDARRRPLRLTARGRACTRAAEASAAEAVRPWSAQLSPDGTRRLLSALRRIDAGGPLRPAW